MYLLREIILATFLMASCYGATKQMKKKTEGLKRGVETYSYPVQTENFEVNQGNAKSKVIVETIKSISPEEYLLETGFIGSTIEASTPNGKVPLGSVTFNAFVSEQENAKKVSTESFVSTEKTLPVKRKSNYRYFAGTSSSQRPTNPPAQGSSTIQSIPVRTTSFEPATTLLPNYQLTARSSNFPQPSVSETLKSEKSLKLFTSKENVGNERFPVQKIMKKPPKIEARISDSKPEETGFNGYHYDVGSLSFESKHSGNQGGGSGGGMMGASYMRSSSPFYNYHVMLD